MKNILIGLLCFILSADAFAQNAHFQTSGVIEFEKTANMYALIKKEMATYYSQDFAQQAFDNFKKNNPQFKKLKSTLTFADNKMLFTPTVESTVTMNNYFDTPMAQQNNIVFTDLATSSAIVQKKVFEETFLLKDSTRKINWKITSETREIAGYTCRRANAIVADSIYVVAFYTDKIHFSGGPECFTGLPGMILGVALPHENVTWFATKVTDMTVANNAIAPPKKGKPVNNKELKTELLSVMKNWGKQGPFYMKAFLF